MNYVKDVLDDLIIRYPILEACSESILEAFNLIVKSYEKGGKLLVAGNGGSAADAEHISGELMKEFCIRRPLDEKLKESLMQIDGERGRRLSRELCKTLEVIPLVNNSALLSAYANDVGGSGHFAQQIIGYGKAGDVFFGISTSGNSDNIIDACVVSKAIGLSVVCLTGESGGKVSRFSDVTIKVPEIETYKVQELHLPVYHCLCKMLELQFFR